MSASRLHYTRGATPLRRQSGIAMVMVLWLVVLMTIVAASFATHSRVETRMAGNLVERQKARHMAETGVSRAVMELLAGGNSEQRWNLNGQLYEMQNPQGKLRIGIRSASGLVDLNSASRQILLNTFKLLTEDEEEREQLADLLEDWRDSDDLKRIRGAEERDYSSEGYAYGTANRDLETVDELGYVMGFNRDDVEKLRPYVTVHSGLNSVDYQYAPDMLKSLLKGGMPLESDVSDAFNQIDSDLAEIDDIEDINSPAGASGRFYRISVEAITEGGARSAIHVDVEMNNKNGKPYTILDWHDSL